LLAWVCASAEEAAFRLRLAARERLDEGVPRRVNLAGPLCGSVTKVQYNSCEVLKMKKLAKPQQQQQQQQ
jgi:hypothetical protein